MLEEMRGELLYFVLSVCCGILLSILGLILNMLHKHTSPLSLWLGFFDVIYWILSGILFFMLTYYKNSGVIRGYSIIGLLIGGALVLKIKKVIDKLRKRR